MRLAVIFLQICIVSVNLRSLMGKTASEGQVTQNYSLEEQKNFDLTRQLSPRRGVQVKARTLAGAVSQPIQKGVANATSSSYQYNIGGANAALGFGGPGATGIGAVAGPGARGIGAFAGKGAKDIGAVAGSGARGIGAVAGQGTGGIGAIAGKRVGDIGADAGQGAGGIDAVAGQGAKDIGAVAGPGAISGVASGVSSAGPAINNAPSKLLSNPSLSPVSIAVSNLASNVKQTKAAFLNLIFAFKASVASDTSLSNSGNLLKVNLDAVNDIWPNCGPCTDLVGSLLTDVTALVGALNQIAPN